MEVTTASNDDMKRLAELPGKFHLIGQLNPRRPGCALFASTLEYRHFRPGTNLNERFVYSIIKFPVHDPMHWSVITLDREFWDLANRVASEVGMVIKEGSPMTIFPTPDGSLTSDFPMQGENVFSIINRPDSPLYGTSGAYEKMIDDETMQLEAIYAEHDRWLAENGVDVKEIHAETEQLAQHLNGWIGDKNAEGGFVL